MKTRTLIFSSAIGVIEYWHTSLVIKMNVLKD